MWTMPNLIDGLFSLQNMALLILFIVALWQTYRRGFTGGVRLGADAILGVLVTEKVIILEQTSNGELLVRSGPEGKSKRF